MDRSIIYEGLSRICLELVKWVVNVVAPKFSKKKKTLLIISNIFYLIQELKKNDLLTNALTETFAKIDEYFLISKKVFLKKLVRKNFKRPDMFFSQILKWRKVLQFSDEMVSLQPTHTIEKFNELNEKMRSILSTGLKDSFSFLRRKINSEELREKLKEALIPYLENQFSEWNEIAQSCYKIDLSVTENDVKEEMNQGHKQRQT